MKKIGVLTFHYSESHGALLQAYALQEILKKLYPKADVKIIDYRHGHNFYPYKTNGSKKLKEALRNRLRAYRDREQHEINEQFRTNYLDLTDRYEIGCNLDEKLKEYTVLISGSDQVWNEKKASGNVYIQAFHNYDEKKYSYAASIGVGVFLEVQLKNYKSALEKFQTISVREESAAKIVNELFGLNARVDVDPTLLHSAVFWNNFADESLVNDKQYILLYMVKKNFEALFDAVLLALKRRMDLVIVAANLKFFLPHKVMMPSTEAFVGLIKNAAYVVTDSFHGTVFSLIFHRKMHLHLREGNRYNVRIASLLQLCGLADNNGEFHNHVEIDNPDWDDVDQRIKKASESSLAYLSSIICEEE